MELTKILQKHIKDISIPQEADLHRKIDAFISQNQHLSEEALFNKIYVEYGQQIKFLEDTAQSKAIMSIKSWVATFGFFFVIGIILSIIYCAFLFVK